MNSRPEDRDTGLSEEALTGLIARFESDDLEISKAYGDGGQDPLWMRLERAALNQISAGDATLPRYAIWANTVRDNIIAAIESTDNGDPAEARRLLVRAANSLSAFAEIQSHFDSFRSEGGQ